MAIKDRPSIVENVSGSVVELAGAGLIVKSAISLIAGHPDPALIEFAIGIVAAHQGREIKEPK